MYTDAERKYAAKAARVRRASREKMNLLYSIAQTRAEEIWLLFTQDLASTAKFVRKRSGCKQKSICEANFAWIFACYWNGVNSNEIC